MTQVSLRLTNKLAIPMSLAVWLANDEYDYVDDINYISVTTLIKSPRQIVLARRYNDTTINDDVINTPETDILRDVSDFMANRFGTAIHGSIEDAWKSYFKTSMQKLGYPIDIINRIHINPELPKEYACYQDYFNATGIIPVFLEKRVKRKIGKYTIGGKYDFVGNGILDDFKTTGVFSYMSGSNDWKYILQGSLYRWLNPDIITGDHMNIQFIFTDWSKNEARMKAEKGYPQTRMFQHKLKLMSVPETELWVQRKLNLIYQLENVPESELPLCEAKDLWQDDPIYKYYKNPSNLKRSTKNFATRAEANIRLIEDGNIGCVIECPGMAKACAYCDVFQACTQKDTLMETGTLKF